jgi:hypothetical protein
MEPLVCVVGVFKKIKKMIKPEKNNRKNRTVKKKPIKILKKPIGSVRFWFFKPGTEKTKPNPNRKKPSQTEQN